MHKGYTTNYFINFFKNIPDHRWTVDNLSGPGDSVQRCALGHCLTDQRTGQLDEYNTVRADALQNLLNNNVEAINDADGRFVELGVTPRGRILKALRNRKRTGNIWGDRE